MAQATLREQALQELALLEQQASVRGNLEVIRRALSKEEEPPPLPLLTRAFQALLTLERLHGTTTSITALRDALEEILYG